MALGEVRRIVAAKRAADQQRSPKLGQTGLELPNGLTRVVMQGGNPQTLGLAESLQRRRQLARLLRERGAVEPVDIEDRRRITGHGYSS